MTTTSDNIKRLFKLAVIADEFGDLVNMKLVDHWCALREEYGLAKLLLLIQKYANENPTQTQTPQVTITDKSPTVVQ